MFSQLPSMKQRKEMRIRKTLDISERPFEVYDWRSARIEGAIDLARSIRHVEKILVSFKIALRARMVYYLRHIGIPVSNNLTKPGELS